MCVSCGCSPLARSRVYEALAAGFHPPDPATADFLASRLPGLPECLERLGDHASAARLAALPAVGGVPSLAGWQEEFLRVFGHGISKECPPYEGEYGQAHIFQQSQAMADVAGFYRAFGLQIAPSFKDRLDHISVELEFMQFLCLKEAHGLAARHSADHLELCREAQRKFLDDHLDAWVPTFVRKLREKAGAGFYGQWGELTDAFITAEVQRLGVRHRERASDLTVGLATGAASDECAGPVPETIGGGIS
ncbi:MAG: molecular chaperone TorD family protein [Chloroflexi bacterium]|nr:molecular chaperone TorD family protein [Chloroflexota bacterium]